MDAAYLPVTPAKPKYPGKSADSSSLVPAKNIIRSPYFSPIHGYKNHMSDTITAPRSPTTFRKVKEDRSISEASSSARTINQESSGRTDSKISRLTSYLGTLKPSLIQEKVAEDPWKLIVAVTLLNKTAGKLAIPIFWEILQRWPTPFELSQANDKELAALMARLGTQNIRSKRLIAISKAYVQEPPSIYDIRYSGKTIIPPRRSSRFFIPPSKERCKRYPATPISHYPGTGPYALDSYRIFSSVCDDPNSEEWKSVMPTDKELIRFLKWKWAFVEGMRWTPTQGAAGAVTKKYLSSLIEELDKDNVTAS